MDIKNWTGERLETFIYTRDAVDHLHRYAIAANFTANKVVLDIASGEGYGSALLSETAAFVHGVDIDASAIASAKSKYQRKNLEFLVGNTSQIPLEAASVDVVVSFETIEHHNEHDEMMAEVKRVLKPDGMLIISTPDKLHYSDKRNFSNQFHIKELYKEDFAALLSKNFRNLQLLTQQYTNGNSIIAEDTTENAFTFYSGNYSKTDTIEVAPLYLVAIASDQAFQLQGSSFFDGSEILKEEMERENNIVYQSSTYKLGHFLLRPVKLLKKMRKGKRR